MPQPGGQAAWGLHRKACATTPRQAPGSLPTGSGATGLPGLPPAALLLASTCPPSDALDGPFSEATDLGSPGPLTVWAGSRTGTPGLSPALQPHCRPGPEGALPLSHRPSGGAPQAQDRTTSIRFPVHALPSRSSGSGSRHGCALGDGRPQGRGGQVTSLGRAAQPEASWALTPQVSRLDGLFRLEECG